MPNEVYDYQNGKVVLFKIEGNFVYPAGGGKPSYKITGNGRFWHALPEALGDKPECERRGNFVYPYFPGATAICEIK